MPSFKYYKSINVIWRRAIYRILKSNRDGKMFDKNLVDEIEDVFVSELGTGSAFILEQNLRELGLTRETFRKDDVNGLMQNLINEYDKLLGNHITIIEKEIKKRVFK